MSKYSNLALAAIFIIVAALSAVGTYRYILPRIFGSDRPTATIVPTRPQQSVVAELLEGNQSLPEVAEKRLFTAKSKASNKHYSTSDDVCEVPAQPTAAQPTTTAPATTTHSTGTTSQTAHKPEPSPSSNTQPSNPSPTLEPVPTPVPTPTPGSDTGIVTTVTGTVTGVVNDLPLGAGL